MVGAEGGRGQKRVGQAEGREGTDKVRGVDGDERVVEKRIKEKRREKEGEKVGESGMKGREEGSGGKRGRRWGRVA